MARVLVPLAPGCEELEAVTVIDLLRRADIEVITASLNEDKTVHCSRGVVLVADQRLDEVLDQSFDMVVLPGGLPGADHLRNDERIIQLLQNMAAKKAYTAAICAAPQVLERAGLLENKKATSYPGVLDAMDLPKTEVIAAPVVIDEQVITSRGPGTAMDFALALIETLLGKDKRQEVEAALMRP